MTSSIILSHAGKQHSYQLAKAMNDLGALEGFYTSGYIRSKFWQQFIKKSGNTLFTRRFLDGLCGKRVHPNWRFELKELLYAKVFGIGYKTQKAVFQRDEKFDRYIAAKVPYLSGNLFWGFQGSAHDSLISAREAGKHAVVELATAHVGAAEKILGEEKQLHPEWADSFDIVDFPARYRKRLENEPYLADTVVAASSFTKSSLLDAGIYENKIKVLPLGADIVQIPFKSPEQTSINNKPLKLLFVGRITQRKGIKYLLEAIKQLNTKHVELHIIGYVHGSGEALKRYQKQFTLHPSMDQLQLFKEYQNYDALVLPSIFEGFGLVIIEAMAAGLPVIATENTMAPDVIEHGKDGYIIPIRNTRAIEESIEKLLNSTPEEKLKMRTNARVKAEQYSWHAYSQRLSKILQEL